MRLTQYAGYSLRVLIYAGLRGRELSTIADISDAYGASRNHLMKVVQQLTSEGFLESRRGKKGGVRLAVAPEDLTVGAVVRAMEPCFGMAECMRVSNECVLTPACRLRAKLAEASEAFLAVLDEVSLADILHDTGHQAVLRNLLDVEEGELAPLIAPACPRSVAATV